MEMVACEKCGEENEITECFIGSLISIDSCTPFMDITTLCEKCYMENLENDRNRDTE